MVETDLQGRRWAMRWQEVGREAGRAWIVVSWVRLCPRGKPHVVPRRRTAVERALGSLVGYLADDLADDFWEMP